MASTAEMLALGMDQNTADLIIQLQLQDVGAYFSSSKGKSREGQPSDQDLAFQLQSQELESNSQLLSDRRMAMSFATAVQTDAHILVESVLEEESARRDRGIARQWTGGDAGVATVRAPQESNLEPSGLDDELLAKLEVMYVSGPDGKRNILGMETVSDSEDEWAESSSWAAQRPSHSPSPMRRCVACREETEFFNVARVPCRHEYCRSCLEDLFKASMTDESLFPPRCCRQPITMNTVRIFLKGDLVHEYERKKVEFETPNRTYCYSPTCSAFINTSNIDGEVATCAHCGLTTCTTCKARAHTGDCPNDIALQQVLATARDNGWQRCYSCWRIVELDHGCNHMICRCGAQFCYNCGERWKNCTCAQWDEHRLLARAYQIIDREQPNPPPVVAAPPPPPPDEPEPLADLEIQPPPAALENDVARTERDDLIARTVLNLRENHECDHFRWRFVDGPHRPATDAEGIDFNGKNATVPYPRFNLRAGVSTRMSDLLFVGALVAYFLVRPSAVA